MNFLRQSTASQSRAIGPFLDDTDFKTAETGLTIANTDIKLMVNGGASANKNSGGGTHRVNGFYGITFDATDTATVGEIEVSVVVAGALPVFKTFYVLEEAAFDAIFAASAAPATAAGVSAVETDTQDIQSRLPAALVSGRIDASVGAMANNVMTAAAAAGDLTTELQNGLATASALSTLDGKADAIQAKTDNLPSDPADQSLIIAATNAIVALLGTPAGASLAADIAAVHAKTTNLPSDPADASVVAGLIAAVQAVVDAIQANTDNLPPDPATETTLATLDALIDAIKAKTDGLNFTGSNVNADIKAVIGDAVQENGADDTNWGGTP